jgi:hypothetical protein
MAQKFSKQGLVDGLLDIHFSKGICEGCVLGKHPQDKFDKGKTRRASSPLELIHNDLMVPFPHPSIRKERYVSFVLMISHISRGFTFSGKNQRSFNTSKISNPLLRHSPERKSKSSEMIMREIMPTMRSIIFFMRQGFSCSTQFLVLHNKMGLLSRKIDL